MTSPSNPSKQEWWNGLNKAEKAIYSKPDSFFQLCAVYIERYRDNLWAARAAHKAIYGAAVIVPLGRNYEAGQVRVDMFQKLNEYATLRDCGADREGAISIMNLPDSIEPKQISLDEFNEELFG